MITEKSLKSINGDNILLYNLCNKQGISINIINYGATVASIKTPDKNGRLQDITLGFDDIDNYMENHPNFGSTIGRYANRIAGGRFLLDGKLYFLDCNEGNNHIHGGYRGFDKVVWQGSISGDKLVMNYLSADGDQRYPGNLDVHITFELSGKNEFIIKYNAVCDKDTIINLTNHTYFNLSGCSRDILDHHLKIYAGGYTPVGDGSIPTGEIAAVDDTPLDFSTAARIGEHINDDYSQLKICNGYDHNYVLDKKGICAEVYDPLSGRTMKVFTDKPGVQFYSGNSLDNICGRDGILYTRNYGLCLETQFFPDSPNHKGFSNCILRKDETYSYETAYCFGVR